MPVGINSLQVLKSPNSKDHWVCGTLWACADVFVQQLPMKVGRKYPLSVNKQCDCIFLLKYSTLFVQKIAYQSYIFKIYNLTCFISGLFINGTVHAEITYTQLCSLWVIDFSREDLLPTLYVVTYAMFGMIISIKSCLLRYLCSLVTTLLPQSTHSKFTPLEQEIILSALLLLFCHFPN